MNQLQKMGQKGKGIVARLLMACSLAMVVVGQAMATPPAEFDTAPILAKFVTFTGYAALILGGLALGYWTLRAFGLVGGRK